MLKTVIVSAALIAAGSFAHAQSLKPIEANSIDLGAAHGSAYYVPEAAGYRVVATLDTGTATPVRFDATLANGQSARISVPAALGEPEMEITFTRVADRLEVRHTNVASDAVTASTR